MKSSRWQLGTFSLPGLLAALVEALMGFQFNHVGGGTKTRRPITLHMKYNSACVQPVCYLLTEEFGEQEVSLEEVQVCNIRQNCRQPLCYPGILLFCHF